MLRAYIDLFVIVYEFWNIVYRVHELLTHIKSYTLSWANTVLEEDSPNIILWKKVLFIITWDRESVQVLHAGCYVLSLYGSAACWVEYCA
jgi:hypothetical protein